MTRLLAAALLALGLTATAAEARRHHHGHHHAYARVKCVGLYCAIVQEPESSRPRDCYGIAWCGCWLRHQLGISDRALNLAINWAGRGEAATADTANVVVWRHHVGRLLEHKDGMLLVRSGNDRGRVTTRWLSPRSLGGVVAYRRVG